MLGKETFIAYKTEENYAKTWLGTHTNFAYPLSGSRPSTNVNMRRKEFLRSNYRSNQSNFLQQSVREVTGGYNFNYSLNLFPLLALSLNLDEDSSSSETLSLNDESEIKSINVLEVFSFNKMVNFEGMCVSSASINLTSLESMVDFTVDFVGVKEIPLGSSWNLPNHLYTPQHTEMPYNILYPSYLSKLEINDEILPFQSISLNFDNNILQRNFLTNNGVNDVKPKIGIREISGNYTIKFDTLEDMKFFDIKIKTGFYEKLALYLYDENEQNPLIFTMNNVQYETGTLSSLEISELTFNVSFIATGNNELIIN